MGEKKQMPRGVTIRKHKAKETINITFTFKGVRCREPLALPVTNSNINYAGRLLGEILNKIERNTFNYADYFPTSAKLRLFGKTIEGVTVKHYLQEYLVSSKERQLSPSTLEGYSKIINQLNYFHKIIVTQLTPAIIKNWIKQQNTKSKTIRNRLSVLRAALDEAVTDGVIQLNPVSQVIVTRYKSKHSANNKDDYKVDPFIPSEVEAILANCYYDQLKNLFQFAFFSGCRSSELCALHWRDIDFDENVAYINQAKVSGIIKGTKTKAGNRVIELNTQAKAALLSQKEITFNYSDTVFHSPRTGKPWSGHAAIRRYWILTLDKAKIRYRNPYQTRHTFATMHISQGVNLFWLAKQMGHKGLDMIFRNYGDYLKEYKGNTEVKIK